jgi:iron complex outermembrane receptor protein
MANGGGAVSSSVLTRGLFQMRMKLFAGVAFAALLIPGAAFAQSTGSIETSEDTEVVVTGSRVNGIDGIVVPDSPKARQVLTNEILNRTVPGNTVLDSLNIIPGVNFTQSDPYGSSGGNIRIRGFDGNRISLTFDGFPLNDTGNYAIYSNQQLDSELIDEVNVNLGTTDIDSPTASAAGGTINYRTIVPRDEFSATLAGSAGEDDFMRIFGLVQTGQFTSFGTKAFVSASMARNDKFKGPGSVEKQQYNVGIYQPLGGNDFIRISGHYNKNRNAFYRNPSINDLRTLLGATRIPASATATPEAPLDLGGRTERWRGCCGELLQLLRCPHQPVEHRQRAFEFALHADRQAGADRGRIVPVYTG